jgi:hypothetical protein
MTIGEQDTQHSTEEIRALHDLIIGGAWPDCAGPGATWDREGREHERLFKIAAALRWALGEIDEPPASEEVRSAFLWLCGAGPCPVDERGHTPGFRVRSRKTA